MKNRIWLISVVLFVSVFLQSSFSQTVSYSSLPRLYQLYPRNVLDNDSATVVISGTETGGNFDSVTVELDTNAVLWRTYSQVLSYIGSAASFSIQTKIYADTTEFRFTIKFWNAGTPFTDTIVDSVVCGDVFLIQGQSNAQAADYGGFVPYQVPWVRSFGSTTTSALADSAITKADTAWGIAQAATINDHVAVGIWGLRLGKLIVDNYGLPVCVINGSPGGLPIKKFQRNDAKPEDLATVYGRLLYRVRRAGVDQAVKALIWWQGEGNTGSQVLADDYRNKFPGIKAGWFTDFPNMQKLYTTQIHTGYGDFGGQLRDYQRLFAQQPDTSIMVAYGIGDLVDNDQHFAPASYDKFANRIFRLIRRDFYGFTADTVDIDPPRIIQAYFTTPSHNVFILKFNHANSLFWKNDTTIKGITYFLKDYFYFHNPDATVDTSIISSVLPIGNTLRFELTKSSNATQITYLPDWFYNNSAVVYRGPWVKNSKGLPALSFYKFPIDSVLGDDSLPVQLSLFSAVYDDAGVRIQWRTESEINNLGFILLKKQGEQGDYREIGSYEYDRSLQGQGTSNYPTDYEFLDSQVQEGETYYYQLLDVDYSGNITTHGPVKIFVDGSKSLNDFILYQNYPNPFNPKTTIAFTIPRRGNVSVKIYNVLGEEVAELLRTVLEPGTYTVEFDSQDLGTGQYYYVVSSGDQFRIKKMLLIR